ncbi:serine hydrolase domain-containing protein [Crossiella cryophila]|uniref:D-alanyl-D-alanine carboxypeptidase n=1 Tax=Crossiella cryophila TaxID=43355 RepID=A0A7W7FVM9_9PSEU|nr:serine hydrolase domain-containing protein [Crossiella cryophila]MBB4680631.1 D-alanyl-D-alanine carboxypeptidase [Crossiella cryophila]
MSLLTRTRRWAVLATVAATAAVALAPGAVAAPPAYGKAAAQAAVNALVSQQRAMGSSAFLFGSGADWSVHAGAVSGLENRPIGDRDHFRIGSLTKMYVSTVVLQLVGEGKLALDTGFGAYLPGLATGTTNDDTKITVRHLLQHTSGIAEYLNVMVALPTNWWRTYDVTAHAKSGLSHGSQFAPGSKYGYSNTNYIILGLIIEKLTGRPVAQEIAERILIPHGLANTGLQSAGQQLMPTPYVTGYVAVPFVPVRVDSRSQDPTMAWAAGAMYSTATDTAKFLDLLLGGHLLPPALLTEMKTPLPGGFYGLGLSTFELPCGVRVYGHNGAIPGYLTWGVIAENGRKAVVLTSVTPAEEPRVKLASDAMTAAVCG